MKRVHRVLVAAATGLTVLAAPAVATAAPPDGSRGELQQELDDIVTAGAVGALVEVQDGDRVWRVSSGVAERGTTRDVPVSSRFRAGSITKTFVATVILQLIDEGRLGLDDTVEAWLPGTVPDGGRITVRQLLNHTSGVYDYRLTMTLPPAPEFLDNRLRTWTAAELVQRAAANAPTFEPPGSAYSYSNTNYILLGQIIEKVTGHSYGDEVKRRIIRPLGLTGTSMPGTDPRIRGPHPHGYVPIEQDNKPQLVDYTQMNPSLMGASGEIISTTRDLNQFFTALLEGRLLPQRLLDEMATPGIADGRYGLGLAWWDTSCGVRVYGNDGDALAYQAWSYSTKDARRQITVALTPNFNSDLDDVVDTLMDQAICG